MDNSSLHACHVWWCSVLVPDLDCGGLLGLLIDALQQVHQLCLTKLGHCKGT